LFADLQSGKQVASHRQLRRNFLYGLHVCGSANIYQTNHHIMLWRSKKGHAIFSTPARASDAALTLPTKSFKAPLCGPQLCPPQHVDPLPPVVANRCVRDLRGASTTPRTD